MVVGINNKLKGAEQRTPEWFLERRGKITASEAVCLTYNHKEDEPLTEEEIAAFREEHPRARVPETKKVDKPFSQMTYTYLDSKIAEVYMPQSTFLEYVEQSNYETRPLRWGNEWEDTARQRYAAERNVEILESPFINMKDYEMFAGGSPDGIIRHSDGIIEIKCPFNPAIHLRHCVMKKPKDLAEENLQYYVQCQYNMIVTSLHLETPITYCDFISFDPRISRSKAMKVLRIPADEEMQELLVARTKLAIEYIRARIQQIEEAMQP